MMMKDMFSLSSMFSGVDVKHVCTNAQKKNASRVKTCKIVAQKETKQDKPFNAIVQTASTKSLLSKVDVLPLKTPKIERQIPQITNKMRRNKKYQQQFLEILLVCNAFNSMSQKAYLLMTKLGHHVIIKEYESEEDLLKTVSLQAPDLIVCPFLTKFIPEEIYNSMPCWIVHPGIWGDRGGSSIDWALKEGVNEWGCTILQASKEADAGPVWATVNLPIQRMQPNTIKKSSVYRNEVAQAAMIGLQHALEKFINGGCSVPLDYDDPLIKGTFKPMMKQADRKIDWTSTAQEVAYSICRSDSQPGVKEEFLGSTYFLYNAWIEETHDLDQLDIEPKTIIAHRDEAILVKCGQGAVWISHLKKLSQGDTKFFKLPATRCLPPAIVNQLAEAPPAPLENPDLFEFPPTFQEIWVTVQDKVAYVFFEFYNGAMNTQQCERLTRVLEKLRERSDIEVVALMGGYDFFSNGIHLNTIEASEDPELESWKNINAIDDVVRQVLLMTDKVTVAAFRGNAGAGGAMMGLAADIVLAHENVVLNPSYQGMNLYGSEYWTYSLPRKVSHELARRFTQSTLPLSAEEAQRLGLIDLLIGQSTEQFQHIFVEQLDKILSEDRVADILRQKEDHRQDVGAFEEEIRWCREHELAIMKKDFGSQKYHAARKAFVYKSKTYLCNQVLPAELA
eukprot:TRINITY_DN895_c0_g1_i1.p1 TRINITY_DN895_c0_g1~~TRINITY_DN895_c0_g1_i1.p1  ORF type:complete len:676 (+),score=115.40 TRINITY_DN895_c0_g1_i1:152-2179(+)